MPNMFDVETKSDIESSLDRSPSPNAEAISTVEPFDLAAFSTPLQSDHSTDTSTCQFSNVDLHSGLTVNLCDSLSEALFTTKEVRTLALTLGAQLPKTIGFTFPESPAWTVAKATPKEPASAPSADASSSSHVDDVGNVSSDHAAKPKSRPKLTRMRPPGDLVKLEDRLYYVLQPPLETLIQSAKLTFPFQPFPYQFEGVAFLFSRAAAILADEMGLGKTMQAITTIRMLLLSGELQSVLLICPKPLVTNWVREFRQWAPEVPVAVIEGDQTKRAWVWNHPQAPVKIANYELMMRDRSLLESSVSEADDGTVNTTPQLHFDLVVLDEAQRIKNRNSTTSEIVRSISRTRSWALTGTPIENSTDDLVSIFEFLSPGYLNNDMPLKAMSQASRDYILRRTKDKVLTEMPPKMFRDAELDLTSEQISTYKIAEEEGVIGLTEMGDEITIQHVFELVLRLKQICNFDPITGASCKLERLEADLEEVASSGQKAIVFSQWVDTLDKISAKLDRFSPLHYHGRIPSRQRDSVIERFKNDPKHTVILMSYGAGAVGLNLQFCHYVFLFDRWWNPAVEDQAINRAHRLGVKGTVTVSRMMAMNTIEQRIHNVLEEKRALINTLFAETGQPKSLGLTQKEIFGLFNLNLPHRNSKAA
jgi:SNF2 family DNA or RNA helicase